MSDLPTPLIESFEFRGQTYFVRELNGKGRATVRKLLNEPETEEREAKLVALGLCDESGTLKYPNGELQPLLDASGGFLGAALAKLFDISGLSAKADEQAAKN
jgi:hypothetical protein